MLPEVSTHAVEKHAFREKHEISYLYHLDSNAVVGGQSTCKMCSTCEFMSSGGLQRKTGAVDF